MKMKHPAVWVSVILAAVLFCSAAKFQGTSIKGTIDPPNGATEVWAVSPTDTVKASISNGSFEITGIKAGTYSVRVEAMAPYKETTKDGVQVTDGAQVDVGEIKLQK